jgi:hypothetical protein
MDLWNDGIVVYQRISPITFFSLKQIVPSAQHCSTIFNPVSNSQDTQADQHKPVNAYEH